MKIEGGRRNMWKQAKSLVERVWTAAFVRKGSYGSRPVASRATNKPSGIQESNAWVECEAFFGEITEADVEWADGVLDKNEDDDKFLGTVESYTARRLFTAGIRLRAMARIETATATLERDPISKAERALKARRQVQMADVFNELFWCEARDDVKGAWDEKVKAIGIRKGWKLVQQPPSNPMEHMARMFGPPQ
jgi:hypothetical protein